MEIATEHRQRDEVSVAVFFTSGMSMGIVARRMASVRASETKAMTARAAVAVTTQVTTARTETTIFVRLLMRTSLDKRRYRDRSGVAYDALI